MPASRSRRIIQWTVIAVAAPVLLLGSYVSSYIGLHGCPISGRHFAQIEDTLYAPARFFVYESDWPGSYMTRRLARLANHVARGDDSRWESTSDFAYGGPEE